MTHNAEVRPFGELLAVVGSRQFARREDVDQFIHATDASTVIVTGCAKDGVDLWAREAARRFGRILVIVEAPWTVHGRRAGPMRNPVVAWIAERLIAFRTPAGTRSNGTDNVVEWADEFGKTREVRS